MKNFSIKLVRAAKMKKQISSLVSDPLDWIDILPQKGLNLTALIFPFPNKGKQPSLWLSSSVEFGKAFKTQHGYYDLIF